MSEKRKGRALEPAQIFAEYRRGISYNQQIDLYETVKQNESFYIGRQWEGVNAPDLDKPVFNVLKRIVSYFIAMLVSDDVSARVEAYPHEAAANVMPPIGAETGLAGMDGIPQIGQYGGQPTTQTQGLATGTQAGNAQAFSGLAGGYHTPTTQTQGNDVCDWINAEIERVIEDTKAKIMGRNALRNAAVDGDACVHLFFDTRADSAAGAGAIRMELVDNTNIYFGNPALQEVQKQPYILIPLRVDVKQAKAEAKRNGCDEDAIHADRDETEQPNAEHLPDDSMTTIVVRYWRDPETGSIWCARAAAGGFTREPWDTGLRLYPVAYFSWELVKNSYHGQAAVSGLIPNQIAINKLYAMYMKAVRDNAFPVVIYDATKLSAWRAKPGQAIAVQGSPVESVLFTSEKLPEASQQAAKVVDEIIALTKDCMGASDAALGNVKPDNTSAIIAVQKASSAPLELQRMAYYQWIEDYVRVMLDLMRAYYGMRQVTMDDGAGGQTMGWLDFGRLEDLHMILKVNVGQSAYWSELMQIQTLDNLFAKGLIPDPVMYLESIPEGYIRNKNELIQALERYQQQQQMMQQAAAMMQQPVAAADLPLQDGTATQAAFL